MSDGIESPPGKRRITLEDGRYLIFYSFDEESGAEPAGAGEQAAGEKPAQKEPGGEAGRV